MSATSLTRISWLQVILGGIAAAAVGAVLLYASTQIDKEWPIAQALVRETGALLIGSSALAFLWEASTKRAFAKEILAVARIAGNVELAGLLDLSINFNKGIDWSRLISSSAGIDIYFSYGRTWRNTHRLDLQKVAENCPAVRIILPDPEDEKLMAHLAERFGEEASEIKARVQEAHKDFLEIFAASAKKNKLQMFYTKKPPVHSIYRFDDTAVLSLYQHRAQKGNVPFFVCEKGGWLYTFCTEELTALIVGDKLISTRIAFPSGQRAASSGQQAASSERQET